MAATSDGVSGCNFFFIGLGGFKNYKLVKFVKEKDNYAEKNVPRVMKFSWQSLYLKRTEPYDTLHKVHVLTALAVAPPNMTLFFFVAKSYSFLEPAVRKSLMTPRFSVCPIIAFIAADGELEVEALPSFLDFTSYSKFYVSCTVYLREV